MEFPRTAVVIAVVFVVMTIFSRAVRRSARRTDESGIMTSPPVLLWTMAVATALPGVMVIALRILGLAGLPSTGVLAVLIFFAALGAYGTADTLIIRVRLVADGFTHRALMQREAHVAWSEVRRVSYSPVWRCWVIETDHDHRRIGLALSNQPLFAAAVLDCAPADAIDSAAAEKLKQSAEGDPPTAFL